MKAAQSNARTEPPMRAGKLVCDIHEIKRGENSLLEKLASKTEAFISGKRGVLGFLHLAMLLFFAALIIVPLFLPAPGEEATAMDDFGVLARFVLWGLWFPLVLLSTLVFGRAWCGLLCPQGALSEYISRFGLNREAPSWIRSEWTPILSFVFVTVLGQIAGVRDYAPPAAEILGGTMVLAALAGFVYSRRRRVWCRHLCPIGLLLGTFSRLGVVSFEGGISGKRACGKKSVCPTFIDLSHKRTSRHCVECFRCANPRSPNSLRLSFRRPGAEVEGIAVHEPSVHEVVFIFGATGLALGAFHWQANPAFINYRQMLGEVFLEFGLADFIGASAPWWAMVNYPDAGEVFNRLDAIAITTFMLLSMAISVTLLILLTALSAVLAEGRKAGLSRIIARTVELGYLYTPVALISIVLGLGQPLFQSLAPVAGPYAVKSAQAASFAGGFIWSAVLSVRTQGGFGLPVFSNLAGIALVAAAWYAVIF